LLAYLQLNVVDLETFFGELPIYTEIYATPVPGIAWRTKKSNEMVAPPIEAVTCQSDA
jgi:hypothetical protein